MTKRDAIEKKKRQRKRKKYCSNLGYLTVAGMFLSQAYDLKEIDRYPFFVSQFVV